MPRYFFHLHDAVNARDEEGTELPDIKAARLQAIRGAREVLAAEVVSKGQIDLTGFIAVETGPGHPEFELSFRDVLTVRTE